MRISGVFEVVGAFLGCEGSEEFTDCCANGFDYARALLAGSQDFEELRGAVERRFGRQGLVALSMMAMYSRNFPVLKRALGHAKTCQRVRVGGADVAVAQALKAA